MSCLNHQGGRNHKTNQGNLVLNLYTKTLGLLISTFKVRKQVCNESYKHKADCIWHEESLGLNQ